MAGPMPIPNLTMASSATSGPAMSGMSGSNAAGPFVFNNRDTTQLAIIAAAAVVAVLLLTKRRR